jgi:nicotinamidase-related amidase
LAQELAHRSTPCPVLHGTPAVIVIDVQKGEVMPAGNGIPIMPGGHARHRLVQEIVDSARLRDIPVIFIQEVHKPSLVDFGRELDGTEGIHCLEGDLATELADGLEPQPGEYLIRKRRYSAFFATELDLVLRCLGVSTLVLVGALTDV